jgi:hypothetical protein
VRHTLSLAVVCVSLVVGCGKKQPAIAELKKTEGPAEKQKGGDPAWGGAAIGTEFFLGDAARTADGGATLEVLGGGAQIAMQPHTVLRFGGKAGQSRIAVELGAIDLTGTGNYALDVGDVKLVKNGTVRITAKGNGQSSVQLTIGEAQVSTVGGELVNLVVGGVEVDLSVTAKPVLVDAGIDAGIDAVPVDAAAEPDAGTAVGEATIEVTGKNAKIQLAGETKSAALPAGPHDLPKGARLVVGPNTTAKLVGRGTTLELAGGSRASVTDDFGFVVDTGSGKVSMTAAGSVGLPGGAIAMKGTPNVPSEARLDLGGNGAKVTLARGTGKLTGTSGSELDMTRGESATLLKNGTIRPLEAIPTFFDFRITPGESFTVHDPRPPTAVQFQFGGKCPEGGIIELDKDARFRTAKVSGGKESANHLVKPGSWNYRLRCTSGAGEGNAVERGRVTVVADGGTRALPKAPGTSPFDVDGRLWTISYQSVLPDLAVKFPGTGSSFRLHLARAGKEITFDSKSNSLHIPGSALSEGAYTYFFDRDGVKQDKVNTLKIDFDQTAAQVYIESPQNGKPWGAGDIDVRGAVVPGWSAAVEGNPIAIDKQRRFIAKAGVPSGNALAIKLSHPQRGIHYYLRRAK